MNPLMTDDLVRDRQRRLVDQAAAHALRRRARATERAHVATHVDRPVRHAVATWLRRMADLLDPRAGARSPGSAKPASAPPRRPATAPNGLQMVG